MLLPIACLTGFIVYLIVEALLLGRRRRSIPLRVTVTGTRGKSGTVRLLASICRQGEERVLSRITGSEALFLNPDGTELPIRRGTFPTIVEQKRTLRLARDVQARILISEIMSIHPENHLAESQRILMPKLVLITNIRPDHTEAQGRLREDAARVFCHDIPRRAAVAIPSEEIHPILVHDVARKDGLLLEARAGTAAAVMGKEWVARSSFFPEILDLVCTAARYMGFTDETIRRGLGRIRQDSPIRIHEQDGRKVYLVDGFGANDPLSTSLLLERIRRKLGRDPVETVGLLTLRADRADRSQQWLEALSGEMGHRFTKVFICGPGSSVIRQRLAGASCPAARDAEGITTEILAGCAGETLLLGMGNMKGAGSQLTAYWEKIGVTYAL